MLALLFCEGWFLWLAGNSVFVGTVKGRGGGGRIATGPHCSVLFKREVKLERSDTVVNIIHHLGGRAAAQKLQRGNKTVTWNAPASSVACLQAPIASKGAFML